MASKWIDLKSEALRLRRRGLSIGSIERRLNIPRSTLSGWLKVVKLSPAQQERLRQSWKDALVKARKAAVRWHHKQKEMRFEAAQAAAQQTMAQIDVDDLFLLEVALAILYLGEGFKRTVGLAIGNSDAMVLRFFIRALEKIYNLDKRKITCELHLRADQDPLEMKQYWAKELGSQQLVSLR